jgi:S1-C subfamily serine protease
MRIAATAIVMSTAMLAAGAAAAQEPQIATGSGVAIAAGGEVLTNAHVVEACQSIKLTFGDGSSEPGEVVARDQRNDLALLRIKRKFDPARVAVFRDGPPLRPGDPIVVLGYPLSGVLATGPNLTVGNISALAGLGDDTRYLQISAPVQPGNSGGPLLDTSGHLVGIVTAKLNAVNVARAIGDIPQNVNFALKAQLVREFLESKLITYKTEKSTARLAPADVGEIARPFTVYIICTEAARVAAAPAPERGSAPAPQRASAAEPEVEAPDGELKGAVREAFIKRLHRSCSRKTHKDYPDMERKTVGDFCTCVANAQADSITPADIAYLKEHHKVSEDYKERLGKLVAPCIKRAGLH